MFWHFSKRSLSVVVVVVLSSIRFICVWHGESAFKQLKDTDHLAVRPFWHWTDEQIRIHIFVCVLVYGLCCLIIKELNGHGIKTNINELLEAMSELKMAETFFGSIDRPEKAKTFMKIEGLAQKVEEIYHLKEKYGVSNVYPWHQHIHF